MPRRLVLAPHLEHLLSVQDGVLTVPQAYECGYTRGSIHHAVDGGACRRLLLGVLLLRHDEPTRRQLVNAAALWAGSGASVDAESACLWHEIPVSHYDPTIVHVVAPSDSGARSRQFVVVRRSDVIVAGGRGSVASYVDAALPPILWNCWLRLPDGGALVCADGLIADAGMVIEVNSKRYHAWALAFEDTEARQLRIVAADLVVAPVTPRRMMVDGDALLRELEQVYLLNAGRGMPTGVEIVADPVRRLAA